MDVDKKEKEIALANTAKLLCDTLYEEISERSWVCIEYEVFVPNYMENGRGDGKTKTEILEKIRVIRRELLKLSRIVDSE